MIQKGSKRKEIKITIEINKTLKRQTTEKNLNSKAVSLKIVIKPSARLIKKKRQKTNYQYQENSKRHQHRSYRN